MATTPSVKTWVNVADGSTLVVTTSAEPPNAEITITIDDGSKTTTWTSDDVLNKSKSLKIRSPKIYTIAIVIAFAGAKTTLKFDARIKKPSGDPHGKPFTFTATRPPNTHHADIAIETKEDDK